MNHLLDERWQRRSSALRASFEAATPFRHVVIVDVVPEAALLELEVPSVVNLYPFSTNDRVQVFGRFEDGEMRDLTWASAGTLYQSSNPMVAEVDADGFVEGHRVGKATITVDTSLNPELSVEVPVVYAVDPLPEPAHGLVTAAVLLTLAGIARVRATRAGGAASRR